VNHELRNALAATYGWAEMLVRKKDPTTVPRAAFEVLESAEGAIALVNDLLDLSRLDEDRLMPVLRSVDVEPIVRRAAGRVEPAATARQVAIAIEVAPGLPTCSTDTSRLEQILVNLLGNGIRHTPERSTVRVRVTAAEGRVLMTVEDQGEGIVPSDVERIFDVYATTGGEHGQGAGLGLPLSRRLARLLGGELHAVPRPGRGGCFVLELPAEKGLAEGQT